MSTAAVLADLQARLKAGTPLFFLKTQEEARWERLLADMALEIDRGLIVWTVTTGWTSAPDDKPVADWSAGLTDQPASHVLLLKDAHHFLNDPRQIRRLRDALPELMARQQAVLFLDHVAEPPEDLRKEAVCLELPLPFYVDLQAELDDVLLGLQEENVELPELTAYDQNRLLQAALGLTAVEARQTWKRVFHECSLVNDEAIGLLIAEKRTLASGSSFLDFYDLETGVDDVGGLDQLKDWLRKRAEAYTPRAYEQGVPLPKGVLLLGVQGCGKSLTARATARLLGFPLIRLDIGNLLSSQRGESERNLRSVLRLLESISPVVLWLDELEKGFAGVVGEENVDATMARLVGQLLTWMNDLTKPVFVIATANSVQQLPPEMLRRGRFDELFFLDLPNWQERKQILEIHLSKRGWKTEPFDLDGLANQTEGFSGAELEQVVVTALIDAFGEGRVVSQDDLERTCRHTVPLSKTMEDQIFALRQWAQDRCRRATSDSRVAQMLESERRHGRLEETLHGDDFQPETTWAQLAMHGQFKAALVECVRLEREVLFSELIEKFASHFSSHFQTNGEFGLAVRTSPNVVLWTGLSKELCDMICELITAKRLYLHPVPPARYEGQKCPGLPLLAELTDDKPARPVWLAVSLRTAPHPVHAGRLSRIGRMKLARS